jgi:hypothetical protein
MNLLQELLPGSLAAKWRAAASHVLPKPGASITAAEFSHGRRHSDPLFRFQKFAPAG